MVDVFSLNDRNRRTSEAEQTIKNLSKSFEIMSVPLIINTDFRSERETFDAPYFTGKRINFSGEFYREKIYKRPKPLLFFIIVNYFGPRSFTSHSLTGIYTTDKKVFIFDPNGNFTPQPNNTESVYSAKAYNNYKIVENLKNPLYRVIVNYFHIRQEIKDVHVYEGEIIPCPAIINSCVYRSFMFMLAFFKEEDSLKAVKLAKIFSKSKEKSLLIKEIAENAYHGKNVKELYKKL